MRGFKKIVVVVGDRANKEVGVARAESLSVRNQAQLQPAGGQAGWIRLAREAGATTRLSRPATTRIEAMRKDKRAAL